MSTSLEVLFTPSEFVGLARRDLSRTTCVVFDVLRATSTMVTALANGAVEIIPVAEIPEALAIRAARPEVLLAGERNGLRIRADLTGSIDFHLGNSPREFTADRVRGRTIVITTTNGTRALQACAGAQNVLVGSFLNLRATVDWLCAAAPTNLLVVCSGTIDQAALEDTLAAGALCDALWDRYAEGRVADSALMARELFRGKQGDLFGAVSAARNGRRLLAMPELRDDVHLCLRRDLFDLVVEMPAQGAARARGR
jgi:2-phosphosulfolactate phosphatase